MRHYNNTVALPLLQGQLLGWFWDLQGAGRSIGAGRKFQWVCSRLLLDPRPDLKFFTSSLMILGGLRLALSSLISATFFTGTVAVVFVWALKKATGAQTVCHFRIQQD